MDQVCTQKQQRTAQQLAKAAIALVLIVAAQVVALEVVLRGWQGLDGKTVFAGIGASALLCALAVVIFLRARRQSSP